MTIDVSEFAADSLTAVEAEEVEAELTRSPSSAPSDEPFGVTQSMTPAGIEIYYQAGPKRCYRVREFAQCRDCLVSDGLNDVPKEWASSCTDCHQTEWVEVPSVTTVLGAIDKSGPLTWWGQGVGGVGAMRLDREHNVDLQPVWDLYAAGGFDDARKALCDLLTQHKISTNHVRDEASDRGVSVHSAFEQWAEDQRIVPQPIVFPDHEKGYVAGLAAFLTDLAEGDPADIQAEVTVASLEHRFAGRYDLRLVLRKPVEVVTRTYPVRKDKVEEIPAGRYSFDLKTSKSVYSTHYLQCEAYEGASVECGYEPTDYRGIIHVTADGKYELHVNQLKNTRQPWSFDDFLATRELYRRMNEVKR